MSRKLPTLADRVTALRAARFPSIRQAVAASADKGRVSLATWTEIENGTNDNPKVAALLAIATTLGCRPSELLETTTAHGVREIPLRKIAINPDNVRQHRAADEEIEALANSIKTLGLLQPITVRQQGPKPDEFCIVFGENRYAATCRAFGLNASIACIVRDISADEQAMLMLAENMQRIDMKPLDVADALFKNSKTRSNAELVAATGKSVRWVQEMISIARHLCPDARTYLEQGHLKISHAAILASVRDQGEQATYAVAATQLTEEQLRKLIADDKAKKAAPSLPLALPETPPSPASDSVPSDAPPPVATPPKSQGPAAVPLQVITPPLAKSLPPPTPVKPSLEWDKTNSLQDGCFHGVIFEPNSGPPKLAFCAESWNLLLHLAAKHFPSTDFLHSQAAWELNREGEPVFATFGRIIIIRTDGL